MEQGIIYGIGTDIVDVWRLRRMDPEHRDNFTRKNLSPREITMLPKENPETFIAGRYAAKEAFAKALGSHGFNNTSVTILNDADGRPCIEDAETLIRNREPRESYSVHLSISHSFDYAVAFVVIEKTVEKSRNTWL